MAITNTTEKRAPSQSWRLKFLDQAVGFSRGLFSWQIDGCLLPVSSHGRPALHVWILISFFFFFSRVFIDYVTVLFPFYVLVL